MGEGGAGVGEARWAGDEVGYDAVAAGEDAERFRSSSLPLASLPPDFLVSSL